MVINVHVAENSQGAAPKDNDGIWRPLRFHSRNEVDNENDYRIEESFRTLRSLLNKLSPANFCKILDKFKSLIIANPLILDKSAAFLVDKAISEPLFSKWYVELLCSVYDGLANDEIEDSIPYRTRMLFVEKLILTFDDLKTRESDVENQEVAVIGTAELQEQVNETDFRFRRNFIGVGRVLAESFILGILPLSSLNRCIEILLLSPKETSLKCLNMLLKTIGKTFEFHLDDFEMNEYFLKINKILENTTLPTKSRFLLLNLLQYKENLWTSRSVSENLEVVEKILHALFELYKTKEVSTSITSSESDFLIEEKEAQCINAMFNKFTQWPRNLASVINLFNELSPKERTKIVKLFIMCVTRGDIYSEDCGKLFVCLIQAKSLIIPDIILGIKTVIHGYRKQFILADQQIWIRLREIFQPLFAAEVFSLSEFENDGDVEKAREIEFLKEEQLKKKLKNKPQESKLSWRRGLPVMKKDKGILKKSSESDYKLNEPEETGHKKDENAS